MSNEEPLPHTDLPPITVPILPVANIWATSTDMADTDHERKQYFIEVQDGEQHIRFALQMHADGRMVAEPYVERDADYWQYDDYDDDEDNDDFYDPCEVSDDDEEEPDDEFYAEIGRILDGEQ
jgi:hypothetical protein